MIEILGPGRTFEKTAELHMHSGNGISPERLVDIAVNTARLSALAITDYNNIAGSLLAQEYARRYNLPIEIIPAAEVSTLDGHVIAFILIRIFRQAYQLKRLFV